MMADGGGNAVSGAVLRSYLERIERLIESKKAVGDDIKAVFADAKANGYTEPDPRDDLSGLDVARKALILARTMGREIDLNAIQVQSLVPDSLTDVSIDEFMAGLHISNNEIGPQAIRARLENAALKYVAAVKPEGEIEVGLKAVASSTVLGALQGPENVVSMRTKRYDEYPVVISGPGAGADVTAAGMIADVLSLAAAM